MSDNRKKVARLGDTSSHGGFIESSGQSGTVIAEGIAIAVEGAIHVCPIEGHPPTPISIDLDNNWYVEGKLVALDGSKAGCGASIIASASRTFGGT